MELQTGKVTVFDYTKEGSSETTHRKVILTSVPTRVVKAISVDGLSDSEIAEVLEAYTEWAEYQYQQLKQIKSFEQWSSSTGYDLPTPSWRSFKVDGMSNVKTVK